MRTSIKSIIKYLATRGASGYRAGLSSLGCNFPYPPHLTTHTANQITSRNRSAVDHLCWQRRPQVQFLCFVMIENSTNLIALCWVQSFTLENLVQRVRVATAFFLLNEIARLEGGSPEYFQIYDSCSADERDIETPVGMRPIT